MSFSQSFARGFGIVTDEKQRKRDNAWRDEQQARTRLGWQREDEARAAQDQLGADIQMGGKLVQEPGYEDATGGLETAAPGKRVALKRSEVAGRVGAIALKKGDMQGFLSAEQQRAQHQEDELIADAMNADPDPALAKYINSNHKSLTIGEPDKQGFRPMSIVKADGTALFHNLSAGEQKKLAAANALMQTNPTRAMQMMAEVNKDLALVVAQENQLQMGAGKENNDSAFQRGSLANDAARTAEMGRHNRASEGIAGAAAQRDRMGQPIPMVGPDGQPRWVIPTMGPKGMQLQPVEAPPGYRMPRQVDPAQRRALAMEMVGTPTGRLGPDGKPEVYTAELAYAAAGRMMGGDDSGGPGSLNPANDAAAILKAQKVGGPNAQALQRQEEIDGSYTAPPKKIPSGRGPKTWMDVVPGLRR